MYLTPKQLAELKEIVDNQILKFSTTHISTEYLTPQEIITLRKMGVDPKTIKPTVDDAFRFGMISAAAGKGKAKDLTFAKVKRALRTKSFLPLDTRELAVLDSMKYQAYHEIRGLGNKLNQDLGRMQVEVDKKQRAKYEKVIRDAAEETVVNRGSVKDMASLIGHKTGDWARDLDRIADYVLHDAHDHGRAVQIKKMSKDDDPTGEQVKCYKYVLDQACKTCVDLYLTDGVGSAPKQFFVDELLANGSNIGRKKADWKPVVGSTHPWCRCEMESLGVGSFTFDAKRNRFKKKLNARAQEISDQTKVTITITED